MNYICDTTDFTSGSPSAVTLGKFDGLHRGHQKLIREILRFQAKGYYGIVFTIAPEQKPVLLTVEEKREILEDYGIDCMIRCPFIKEILSMEPETFVAEVLIGKLHAKQIVVGTDFRFGFQRSGDTALLARLQEKYGFTLTVIEKECFGDREISSTYIKEVLARGDIELVQTLLGFPYPVLGTVQHGRQLGRRIGMPTINLVPDSRKLLPPEGVYFSEAVSAPLTCYGITNIGYKPTVDGSFLGVETYLYGVSADLYDKKVKINLRSFRRPEMKFSSVDELKKQMEKDINSGKEYFGIG